MKRIIPAVLLAAPLLMLSAGGVQAQVLGFGTAPQGSIGYNMGSAIAKVLSQSEHLQSRVQPHSGSSAILPLVNTGELDLTVCNVLEIQEAVNGEGPYNGRKQPNLRVLGVIFPIYVGIFVKKDSPIRSIADLKGKRVTYGYTAQVTLKRVVDAVLATGGLTGNDIVPVLVPNVVRGADDFAEGKADGGFFAVGAGKVTEVDKAVGGIRFLSLPDDPQSVAAMKKLMSYGYLVDVKPSPAFAGIVKPTKLMAYDYLVVAGAHVKDDVVYRAARAIHDHKDDLVASLRAFRGFHPDLMHKKMPAPFHRGALKYYGEKGLGTAK